MQGHLMAIFRDANGVEQHYTRARQETELALQRRSNEEILSRSDDDLVAEFIDGWQLDRIDEDPGREPSAVQDFGHAIIVLPLVPRRTNRETLQKRPNAWPMIMGYEVEAHYREQDEAVVVRCRPGETPTALDLLRKRLSNLNGEVERYR